MQNISSGDDQVAVQPRVDNIGQQSADVCRDLLTDLLKSARGISGKVRTFLRFFIHTEDQIGVFAGYVQDILNKSPAKLGVPKADPGIVIGDRQTAKPIVNGQVQLADRDRVQTAGTHQQILLREGERIFFPGQIEDIREEFRESRAAG